LSPLAFPEVDPRPGLNYPLHETRAHRLIVSIARRVFPLFMSLEVSGVENLLTSGAAVVAANHLVMYDVFPLQLALPRMVYYMGKAELFQVSIVHFVFRQMGAFPIYRGEHDVWAMNHARQLLNTGKLVAMFPEGTRSGGKGLALARPGAAKLAIDANCPLVAVSIDGIQNLFKKFPRRTVVRVVIAPPIWPKRDDSPLVLTDTLMYTLAENLPVELRGVYAKKPKGF